METTAKLRGVRLSAQKGRLVADQVRGLPVDRALNVLQFSPKRAATIIRSIETGKPRVIYGNVANDDLIDDLPRGCTVEVPCLVDGTGVRPTRVGALPPQLAALQLGSAPPTLAFVVGAWGSPNVLRQGKKPPKALLEERIGTRAAESMAKGLLRSTRVSLRVAYTFQQGVTPEVSFDPMLVPLVRPDLLQKAL